MYQYAFFARTKKGDAEVIQQLPIAGFGPQETPPAAMAAMLHQ